MIRLPKLFPIVLVALVVGLCAPTLKGQQPDCSTEHDYGASTPVDVADDPVLGLRKMWAHIRTLITPEGPPCAAVVTTFTDTNGVVTVETSAPAMQLPTRLLTEADLIHQGSFTIPDMMDVTSATPNGLQFCAYTNGAIAYNPARNSLFLACHDHSQTVAEISIPALGGQAAQLQAPRDAFEGRLPQIQPPNAISGSRKIGGCIVVGSKLICSAYVYYDADFTTQAVRSHFIRDTNLSSVSVQGPVTVGTGYGGTHAGPFTAIPTEWQAVLGGDLLNEGCCHAITSLWSQGPSAASLRSADLLSALNPTPANRLVYYPYGQHELDGWASQSQLYNGTTEVTGSLIVPNTATLMHVGKHGTGPFSYPPEAPPYRPQVWFYNLADLAAVKAGTKQVWEPRPYRVGALPGIQSPNIGGMAYDPSTGRIFVTENYGDGIKPRIHVLTVSGTSQNPPPPPPPPPPSGDTTPPTVTFSITPTQVVSEQDAQFTATASDNVGVTKVEFVLNGTILVHTLTAEPWTWTWPGAGASSGTRNFAARAYDAAGNSTLSNVVVVTIGGAAPPPPPPPDTTPPSVSVSVDTFTIMLGQSVLLSADALDNVGVTSVQFLANGSTIGAADTVAPYTLSWTPPAVGTYTVSAAAHDAAGNQGVDATPETVTVNPVPPPPVNPCVANPGVLTVSQWPLTAEGSRRLTYSYTVAGVVVTVKAVSFTLNPNTITVTDSRGCVVTR